MRRVSSRPNLSSDVQLRPPRPGDHLEIAALIAALIPRYLGRGFSAQGLTTLRENTDASVIGAKLGALTWPPWEPAIVAVTGSRVIGFGAVRHGTHITQLHVNEQWHGRSIGGGMVRALIAEICSRNPRATEVTLNAVISAVTAYEHMGFLPIGPCRHRRGIVSQPMVYPLITQRRGG